MSLEKDIQQSMISAMKAKDQSKLEVLRAMKAAIQLVKTETGQKEELSDEHVLKLLQKLKKQRQDAFEIFQQQNRSDLAKAEEEQMKIIEEFLPSPLTEEEITELVSSIITQTGASSMKDMGKVMGMANAKAAGRADGKTLSNKIKELLS